MEFSFEDLLIFIDKKINNMSSKIKNGDTEFKICKFCGEIIHSENCVCDISKHYFKITKDIVKNIEEINMMDSTLVCTKYMDKMYELEHEELKKKYNVL